MIDMLWRFHVAANEPATREIARVIAELPDDQRNGTANHETVRRTLGAVKLPQWPTVEVIFLALCQIANVDPDDTDVGDDDFNNDRWEPRAHREQLRWSYQLARHGVVTTLPRTRDERARQEAEEAERARQAEAAWRSRADDELPF
ncbi:hypothetical protein [Nocardia sp. NPDC019255]|uniref:hypothetical protein n=1 Tax=Nocardia sp. NPDC019255 TaxID=3154591 RepID=UPI0033E6C1BC